MQTLIKSGNTKLWMYVGALVLMAGLWKAGEFINTKLANLPIKTAPKAAKISAAIDQKSFYTVWVKRLTSSSPAITEDDQAVENLFHKKEEAVAAIAPTKPAEPDYVQIFKSTAKITGVSDDGVFISGNFYHVGQKLDHLAMKSEEGKSIVPILQSIRNGKVTFTIGKRSVVFLIGKV